MTETPKDIDEKTPDKVPEADADKLKAWEEWRFRMSAAWAKIDARYDEAKDWTKKKLQALKDGAQKVKDGVWTWFDNFKKAATTNPFKKPEDELPPPEWAAAEWTKDKPEWEWQAAESSKPKTLDERKKDIMKGQEVKEWAELDFKFGSPEDEEKIWLSDLLPKEVRKIQIISGEKFGKKYDGEVGTRQWPMWGFYTDSKEYVPVFNDFKIKVLEYDPNYIKTFEDDKTKKVDDTIKKLEEQWELQKFKDMPDGEAKLKKIIAKAVEYGVDPYMLMDNISKAYFFNLEKASLEDMDIPLTMACRKLQTAQNRYESVTKKSAAEDGMFTPEFLWFYYGLYWPAASWDPENSKGYSDFNKDFYAKALKSYGKHHWKTYSDEDVNKYSWESLNLHNSLRAGNGEVKWKTTPDDILEIAMKYLWWKYKMWWSGEWPKHEIDCSQLVVQCMKYCKSTNGNGIVSQNYDNTAQWLYNLVDKKPKEQVKKWDLVFLFNEKQNRITHVEIATGPAVNGEIPIIDASSNAKGVRERKQSFSYHNWKWKVLVWTPRFY